MVGMLLNTAAFRAVTVLFMVIIVTTVIPAAPIPAIALPTIKHTDVGDAPHSTEPASKIRMATKKVTLSFSTEYNFPNIGQNEHN